MSFATIGMNSRDNMIMLMCGPDALPPERANKLNGIPNR
jgi:hypothetical protein